VGISPVAISAPVGLTLSIRITPGDVNFGWTANGAAYYNIYYSTQPDLNPLNGTLFNGAATPASTLISGLDSTVYYYFIVTAVDVNGNESVGSEVMSIRPIGVAKPLPPGE
jgi:hypothetical protein